MQAVPRPIRFAAAGDIHADDANRDDLARAFRNVDGTVDLILLAGDLTTYGEPEQAALLAEICRPSDRKSTRLNSSHPSMSYAVFCLKKKKRSSPTDCPSSSVRARSSLSRRTFSMAMTA